MVCYDSSKFLWISDTFLPLFLILYIYLLLLCFIIIIDNDLLLFGVFNQLKILSSLGGVWVAQ